jgi:hypothetical protein
MSACECCRTMGDAHNNRPCILCGHCAGETPGPEGFYVTMKRGSRTAYLLGPFGSKPAAEAQVSTGRRLATEADAFHAFDAFGVTRVAMKPGAALPAGVLNSRAAAVAS